MALTTYRAPAWRTIPISRIAVTTLAAFLTLGCDDAAEPDAVGTIPPETVTKQAPLAQIEWLDQRDRTTPEIWLASREANANLGDEDPAVLAMHERLQAAHEHFRDPPRMIANRAVQLERMLAEQGINEHAPELIEILSSAAGPVQLREGFGSMCQHYFYLRKQGLDRAAALAELKDTSSLDTDNKRRT